MLLHQSVCLNMFVRQGGDEILNLKEISRILKPSGLFICFHLPNKYSLIELAARHFNARFVHQFRYTNHEIKRILSATDFATVFIRPYGFLPNSWGKFPRIIRNNAAISSIYNWVDVLLSFVFRRFCQNFFVVAKNELD